MNLERTILTSKLELILASYVEQNFSCWKFFFQNCDPHFVCFIELLHFSPFPSSFILSQLPLSRLTHVRGIQTRGKIPPPPPRLSPVSKYNKLTTRTRHYGEFLAFSYKLLVGMYLKEKNGKKHHWQVFCSKTKANST
jgi:hypothetical protein